MYSRRNTPVSSWLGSGYLIQNPWLSGPPIDLQIFSGNSECNTDAIVNAIDIARHSYIHELPYCPEFVIFVGNKRERVRPIDLTPDFLGGDDETRTRDLRRDRPAF